MRLRLPKTSSGSRSVRCAETAAQIAEGSALAVAAVTERSSHPRPLPRRPPLRPPPRAPNATSSSARQGRTPPTRVHRVEASIAEGYREILVTRRATGASSATIADGASASARSPRATGDVRQARRAAAGASDGVLRPARKSPTSTPRGPASPSRCSTRARRRPARWRWCSAPATLGSCLHGRWATALEADFNRRDEQLRGPRGHPVASSRSARWSTAATSTTAAGRINVDDEGNVPACRPRSSRAASSAATSIDELLGEHFAPDRQQAAASFRCAPLPRMTNTLSSRAPRPRGDRPVGEEGIFATRFGGGQVDIASGDFRLLALRGLPHPGTARLTAR